MRRHSDAWAEPVRGQAGPAELARALRLRTRGFPSLLTPHPCFSAALCPAASERGLPSASRTGAGGFFNYKFNYKFLELTSPLPSRSLPREPRVLISVKLAGDSARSCGRARCQGHSSSRVKVQTEKSSRGFHQPKSFTETRCSQGRGQVLSRGSVVRVCAVYVAFYVFMKLGPTPSHYLAPTLASNSASFKLKAKTVITLA